MNENEMNKALIGFANEDIDLAIANEDITICETKRGSVNLKHEGQDQFTISGLSIESWAISGDRNTIANELAKLYQVG